MQRKRTMLWTAVLTIFCALLIGYFALQSGADEAVGTYPNARANHHPKPGDSPTN